jgi:tetratricopeptide (TPR) repeat protein
MAFDKKNTSLGMKIGIIVVCVILALAMTIPSLSALLGSSSSSNTSSNTTSSSNTTLDIPSSSSTVDETNTYYSVLVDALQKEVDKGSTSVGLYEQLGNDYFDWANALTSYHSDDTKAMSDAAIYWSKAISAYDTYLASNSKDAVSVDRAIATYQTGDEAGAISLLETFTATVTDYPQAWYYLGYLYQEKGDTANAKAAYQKVLDTDPNDTLGVKDALTSEIASM